MSSEVGGSPRRAMAARRRRQDWSRPLGPSPSRFAHLASWWGAFSAPPDTSLQAFGLRRQRDASDRIRNGGKSILARTRRGKAGMLNSERWRVGPPTSAADSRRWPDPRKGGPSAPASGGFGLDKAPAIAVSRCQGSKARSGTRSDSRPGSPRNDEETKKMRNPSSQLQNYLECFWNRGNAFRIDATI